MADAINMFDNPADGSVNTTRMDTYRMWIGRVINLPSNVSSILVAIICLYMTWLSFSWLANLLKLLVWPISISVFVVYILPVIPDCSVHRVADKTKKFMDRMVVKFAK